jgi:dihydrofolate reductase
VFIGASVDGFIARENGDLDFLEVRGDSKGEDYGYKAFVGEIDAVVMGRKTFEKVLTLGAWSFGKTPVVVLTTRPLLIPPKLRRTVETMADRPAQVVERLSRVGLHRLYVDGGRTVQGFLRAGLVDEITIARLPVLIGNGVPLFGALPADVKLRHLETRGFRSGIVQSTYTISRKGRGRRARAARGEGSEHLSLPEQLARAGAAPRVPHALTELSDPPPDRAREAPASDHTEEGSAAPPASEPGPQAAPVGTDPAAAAADDASGSDE